MANRTQNNRPWPENLIFEFELSPSTTPQAAEAFIDALPTTDRNREFLRLRFKEGKQYTEIAPNYGITPSAVRQGIKYAVDRYLRTKDSASRDDLLSGLAADDSAPQPPADTAPQPPADTDAEAPAADREARRIREELKPIVTALASTTRQRTFVYDIKTRIVITSDNIPRGLRGASRYVPLPDFYQIKEYDLMQAFADSLAETDPDKSAMLSTALEGLGPFRAFRSTLKELGLSQAWTDHKNERFMEMAEDWWERAVVPALAARDDEIGPVTAPSAAETSENGGVLIVDPAALNGIALIETIRALYRRVEPEDFEEALDELRDALCSISAQNSEAQ